MTSEYAEQIKALLAEDDSIQVEVQGRRFPVSRPSMLKISALLERHEAKKINDMELGVKIVKLCLPEGLEDDEVSLLMQRAGYFSDGPCPLREAVETFTAVDPNQAFDAGASADADQDFGAPGPNESE